ncbi:MAG: hypothetical protein ACJ8FU_22820 [Xanthobacteraceae bacterium]
MTLAYPIDISREIDRKWQRRLHAASTRRSLSKKGERAAERRCPACGMPAPIAPIASAFLGAGLIHHQWLCGLCAHAWTTAVRIPS